MHSDQPSVATTSAVEWVAIAIILAAVVLMGIAGRMGIYIPTRAITAFWIAAAVLTAAGLMKAVLSTT